MRIHALESSSPPADLPSTATHATVAHSDRLHVSPFLFRLCWWFIAAMHFFNGSLALAFSIIYSFFSLDAIYATISMLEVPLILLRISGGSYLVIAIAHWYALGCLVRWSSQRKRLTFSAPVRRSPTSHRSLSLLDRVHAKLLVVHRFCWSPWRRLFGIDGVFGLNGRYFHAAFLCREALEIVLQTYQANQLSRAVRRPWITDLAVATIVLNAVSSPLVWLLQRHQRESVRRFTIIVLDMLLDFCSAAIIPLCVVYPFVTGYDATSGLLPLALVYDDAWFTSAIAEIRQFCVTSGADLLATMMPHVTVLTCLSATKILVRRRAVAKPAEQEQHHRKSLQRVLRSIVLASRIAGPSVVPSAAAASRDLDSNDSFARLPMRRWFSSKSHGRLLKLYFACAIAWALAVVGIHIHSFVHATSRPHVGCRLVLNAWLVEHTPCSVVQINCHRDRIHGTAVEITAAVAPLDRSLLKKVIFTHCPALEIPPALGAFSSLTVMDIYNSSLVSWPREAAATPSSFASLISFNWFASPYISFPAGLLHDNLPKSFARFSLVKTNMTELPEDLGTVWATHPMDDINLELSRLRRLPSSFRELRVSTLRVIASDITEIADDALANKALSYLQLSGNRLTNWPVIGDTSCLVNVMAESTLLTNLSSEVQRWWSTGRRTGLRPIKLSLFGSPYCSQPGNEALDECSVDYGNADGIFTWDLITAQRALDL